MVDYPRDDNLNLDEDEIFGNGQWNATETGPPPPGAELRPSTLSRNDYQDYYHSYIGHPMPPGLGTLSRWGMYQWELGSDGSNEWQEEPVTTPTILPILNPALELTLNDQEESCADTNWFNKDCKVIDGNPTIGADAPNRRAVTVAILKCEELGLHGSEVDVPAPRFGHFFITEHILPPGGGNEDKVNIYAEYIDDLSELDADYHVEVQLYE